MGAQPDGAEMDSVNGPPFSPKRWKPPTLDAGRNVEAKPRGISVSGITLT